MNEGSQRYDRSTALVVVDLQNDFADPGGSLHVAGGDEIVDGVNEEIRRARANDSTVVLTQDWHPPRSPHFVTGGGTWPEHCVRGTWGARLHPDLSREADLVLRKGTGGEDGYSAFTLVDPESGRTERTGLAGYLEQRGIERVVTVGLAADVCVRATALDALAAGMDSLVPWSLTRAVELEEGDGQRAAEELRSSGVEVVAG